MNNNYASIWIMLLFILVVYLFVQYLKEKFASKIGLEKDFDLFYILYGLVTTLFGAVFLMQDTIETQNNVFAAWFSFVVISLVPFILILLVAFFKRALHIWTRNEGELNYENKDK